MPSGTVLTAPDNPPGSRRGGLSHPARATPTPPRPGVTARVCLHQTVARHGSVLGGTRAGREQVTRWLDCPAWRRGSRHLALCWLPQRTKQDARATAARSRPGASGMTPRDGSGCVGRYCFAICSSARCARGRKRTRRSWLQTIRFRTEAILRCSGMKATSNAYASRAMMDASRRWSGRAHGRPGRVAARVIHSCKMQHQRVGFGPVWQKCDNNAGGVAKMQQGHFAPSRAPLICTKYPGLGFSRP